MKVYRRFQEPRVRGSVIKVVEPDMFHRCHVCGEYPELAGDSAIKVALDGGGFHWGICAACVDLMHEALHATEIM